MSIPPLGTSNLNFPTWYPQKYWEQFKACLWKQNLSYWRTPSYNLVRIIFITVSCIAFGVLFWQQGNIDSMYVNHHFIVLWCLISISYIFLNSCIVLFVGRNDQQGLFTILGCMYGTTLFAGINNCQSVMPFISIERSVVYRERFAGMYSPWAYSFAQVNKYRLGTSYLVLKHATMFI